MCEGRWGNPPKKSAYIRGPLVRPTCIPSFEASKMRGFGCFCKVLSFETRRGFCENFEMPIPKSRICSCVCVQVHE